MGPTVLGGRARALQVAGAQVQLQRGQREDHLARVPLRRLAGAARAARRARVLALQRRELVDGCHTDIKYLLRWSQLLYLTLLIVKYICYRFLRTNLCIFFFS